MSRLYTIQLHDGEIDYPSVTTIISEGTDQSGLIWWSADCVAKYIEISEVELVRDLNLIEAKNHHKTVSEEAMDVGSIVHSNIEWMINTMLTGIVANAPTHKASEATFNAIQSFGSWLESVRFKPLASEMTVYNNKFRYAGTLDCLAYVDGKLYIIDFKTSKAHYNTAGFQMSAYRKALIEMIKNGVVDLPIPQGCAVLRLDKETGEYDWKDYSKRYMTDWAWFKREVEQFYLAKNRRCGKIRRVKNEKY